MDSFYSDLKASGIPIDVAESLGIRPVDADEASAILGFPVDKAGYVIPYLDPLTGQSMLTSAGHPYSRIKFYDLVMMPDGPAKYLSPLNSGQRAYILQQTHKAITEDNARIVLTEGEKKAIKATISGIPMIGLPGNFGFLNSKTGDLLEELQRYLPYAKEWTVIWDSDAAYNINFALASHRLAACLATRGIKLRELILPHAQETT